MSCSAHALKWKEIEQRNSMGLFLCVLVFLALASVISYFRMKKRGEDFAKLAREYSQDAGTRAEGGDLGFIGRDILPKPLEELVFSMKVGDVKGPVRADRGFHIIKLVDTRAKDAKPFADVQDEIRVRLRQREMERQTKIYLAELRKKVLVDIRL